MRTIRVYGALAKFVGRRSFEAVANSAAEAVRFLAANFPGLDAHMAQYHYAFLVGGESINPHEQLHDPVGQAAEICVVPVLGGAGGPVGRIIAGIGLVALSFVTGGAAIGLFGLAAPLAISPILLGLGASMALGGVAELLSPVPVLSGPGEWGQDDSKDSRKNYAFSGISNTARVGMIVPFGYGKSWTGSLPVSQTIDLTSDVAPYVEPIVIGAVSILGANISDFVGHNYLAVQSGKAAGTTYSWTISPMSITGADGATYSWNDESNIWQFGWAAGPAFGSEAQMVVAGLLPETTFTLTVTAINPNAGDSPRTASREVTLLYSTSGFPNNQYTWLSGEPNLSGNSDLSSYPAIGVPAKYLVGGVSGVTAFEWIVTPSDGVIIAPVTNSLYLTPMQEVEITFPRSDISYKITSRAVNSNARNNGELSNTQTVKPGYLLGPVYVTGPSTQAPNTTATFSARQEGLISGTTWSWAIYPSNSGATITGSGATISVTAPPTGSYEVQATAANSNAVGTVFNNFLVGASPRSSSRQVTVT